MATGEQSAVSAVAAVGALVSRCERGGGVYLGICAEIERTLAGDVVAVRADGRGVRDRDFWLSDARGAVRGDSGGVSGVRGDCVVA